MLITRIAMLFVVTFFALALCSSAGAQRIVSVDFSSATLSVSDDYSAPLFISKVVLPKGKYYPVPVGGTVRSAKIGPTWTPTSRMHRDFPGRYKQYYRPYEAGNAMGACKIKIDFDVSHPLLRLVRIHGNAREIDLGKRLSRSCVRIPDRLCRSLVDAINNHPGVVRVHFHY